MRKRRFWLILFTLLLCTFLFYSCSDGSSSSSNGNGNGDDDNNGATGNYLISAYMGWEVADGNFEVYIARLDSTCESAKNVFVEVNDVDVPCLALLSTDDDAVFATYEIDYEPSTSYNVVATLGSMTGNCSFTTPNASDIDITSPSDGAGFTPGSSITVNWDVDGSPDKVHFLVTDNENNTLLEENLSGSATTYTISGSVTSSWSDYYEICISVDLGEYTYPFTGNWETSNDRHYPNSTERKPETT